jgi:hypothetical protein
MARIKPMAKTCAQALLTVLSSWVLSTEDEASVLYSAQ